MCKPETASTTPVDASDAKAADSTVAASSSAAPTKSSKALKQACYLAIFFGLCTLGLLGSTISLAVQKNNASGSTASGSSSTVEVAATTPPPAGTNPCEGKKPDLPNVECIIDGIAQTGEQAGANITKGYNGSRNTTVVPITVPYYQAGLCPINVHWHLGAEHYSLGQFDETGSGPSDVNEQCRLASKVRECFQCKLYDESDSKFTTDYNWQHCKDMEVGQTYEVHWPHSAAGACGTVNQYQMPFYDGVFCMDGILDDTAQQVGVQAQVFTIINDESYYYPDLMRGMIVDGDMGTNMAMYTGSTTSTMHNNEICLQYAPITWQVDRKCHLVSASTFDKMCADMKAQRDDMSDDLHAHGSQELVTDKHAANNHANLRHA